MINEKRVKEIINPIIKYCLNCALLHLFIIVVFKLTKFITTFICIKKAERRIEKENEDYIAFIFNTIEQIKNQNHQIQ